jgi:hypothetical protein
MNDLIENNSLNLLALQKVLNSIVINLGKNVLETKDFKKSFKRSTHKTSSNNHDEDEIDNDNLSRQSDEVDYLEIDQYEVDDIKNIPLKISKNDRRNSIENNVVDLKKDSEKVHNERKEPIQFDTFVLALFLLQGQQFSESILFTILSKNVTISFKTTVVSCTIFVQIVLMKL